MPRRQGNPYAPHDWAPHEKPALLGSPSTPLHSPAKRLAYGVVGLLVCSHRRAGQRGGHRQPAATAGHLRRLVDRDRLAAGGVRHDQRLHQPAAGEISPAVWARAPFTEGFLVLYVLVTFFHLFVNDLSSAIMVRAAHGMAAAALSSLGDLLSGAGLARTPPPERADHRHHRLIAGHTAGASLFHRAAADR